MFSSSCLRLGLMPVAYNLNIETQLNGLCVLDLSMCVDITPLLRFPIMKLKTGSVQWRRYHLFVLIIAKLFR